MDTVIYGYRTDVTGLYAQGCILCAYTSVSQNIGGSGFVQTAEIFDTSWGIRAEVEAIVCLRLIGSARYLRNLDDGAQMGKETIRRYFAKFCQDIRAMYVPVYLNHRPTIAELDAIVC